MPRDAGLEQMVNDALRGEPGLTAKAMFGGWAWLLRGNLLCTARVGRLLFRVGVEAERWALEQPGVDRMAFERGRPRPGWVRVYAEAYGDPAIFDRMIAESLQFVRSLPAKPLKPAKVAKRAG